MKRIESLVEQIDDVRRVSKVRAELVDLLLVFLNEHKDTLDDWKKTHFSNSIGALSLNIHGLHQPTTSWLRLSLADLKRAVLPVHVRDANFRTTDPSMRDVTYRQLVDAVDALGRELVNYEPRNQRLSA